MFRIEECLSLITRNSSKIFSNVLSSRLKEKDVGLSEWMVLYYLSLNGGITQTELANNLSVTAPSLGRQLSTMEDDGLITRSIHDDDLRIRKLYLTKKGSKLGKECNDIVIQFKNDISKGITQKELEQMRITLDKMVDNVITE